jgi:hypothetical protein
MTATTTGPAARTTVDGITADGAADYSAEDLSLDLRWWATANYLTAAQISSERIHCWASRCGPNTSSRDCSGTGAPARA